VGTDIVFPAEVRIRRSLHCWDCVWNPEFQILGYFCGGEDQEIFALRDIAEGLEFGWVRSTRWAGREGGAVSVTGGRAVTGRESQCASRGGAALHRAYLFRRRLLSRLLTISQSLRPPTTWSTIFIRKFDNSASGVTEFEATTGFGAFSEFSQVPQSLRPSQDSMPFRTFRLSRLLRIWCN
jgi:hypothetical protein